MNTKSCSILHCSVFLILLHYLNAEAQFVKFTEVADSAGLWDQSIYNERYSYDGAHQAVWVDYDSDGDLDLFYTEALLSFLYQNQGNGTFISAIEGTGLKDDSLLIVKEGSTWCDLNNDGFPDVLLKSPAGGESVPILFLNSARGTFEGVTSSCKAKPFARTSTTNCWLIIPSLTIRFDRKIKRPPAFFRKFRAAVPRSQECGVLQEYQSQATAG